jgi:hypothetical protein
VTLTQYENKQWEAIITVMGWAKLMNRNPYFSGIEFSQSAEEIDSIPQWMECSIYRSDRVLPICLREYFIEVQGDIALWKKMPRRMLRHRVFSQCAKMAFGLNI